VYMYGVYIYCSYSIINKNTPYATGPHSSMKTRMMKMRHVDYTITIDGGCVIFFLHAASNTDDADKNDTRCNR